MSSHYIYVKCHVEECPTISSLYTGEGIVEGFLNDSWEGETITAICDKHAGTTK